MKTHHFYYLTLALILLGGGLLVTLFISETIFAKDLAENTERIIVDPDLTTGGGQRESFQASHYADTTSYLKGIDISKYQKDIDWSGLSNKITFIICKATEGRTLMDSEFDSNWKNIEKAGRYRGAYHFYRSNDDPEVQAEFFYSTVGELKANDLPMVLDIESGSLVGAINKTKLTADLLSFLQTVEKLSGKKPMIYSNSYFASQYLNQEEFATYPLWVAEYTSKSEPTIPYFWTANSGWSFWQRSASYDLSSVDGEVDFDIFNGNMEALKNFISSTSEEDQ